MTRRHGWLGVLAVVASSCGAFAVEGSDRNLGEGQRVTTQVVLVESGPGGRTPECTSAEGPSALLEALDAEFGWAAYTATASVTPELLKTPLTPLSDPPKRQEIGDRYLDQADVIFDLQTRVAAAVEHAIRESRGRAIFVFSGAHTTAVGTLAGIWRVWPKSRVCLLWVDAHADINTPWTSPSGNPHGMPVAAMANLGRADADPSELPDWSAVTEERVTKAWNAHRALLNDGALDLNDIVYFSVRDLDGPEKRLFATRPLLNVTTEEIQSDLNAAVARAVTRLEGCDRVLLNIDVDSLDLAHAGGTGTPYPGGLDPDDLYFLANKLAAEFKDSLVAVEITETDPVLNRENGARALEYAMRMTEILRAQLQDTIP